MVLSLGLSIVLLLAPLSVEASGQDGRWLDALRGHDIKAAAALVDTIDDVDLAPADGRTALMLAAKRGLVDFVRKLLKKNANANASNSNGGKGRPARAGF